MSKKLSDKALAAFEKSRDLNAELRALQDWEQGRREPSGAAQTSLKIAARHPRVLREAVSG